MQLDVYDALKGWAGISTWHTGHPVDEARFREAVATLRELDRPISSSDLRHALNRHRDENLEILGGKPSKARLEEYVRKLIAALGSQR